MDAIELAEEVIGSYSLRSYRTAYRQGVVCGCRSCQGEMKRWADWAAEDDEILSSSLTDPFHNYINSAAPTRNRYTE